MFQGDFIFVCGSVIVFALLIGFAAFTRYLSYRETVALAEKGLVRADARNNGRGALVWGILIAAVGLALCLGLWPLGYFMGGLTQFPLGLGPWMLVGLLPLFFGLGLILIYVLTRDTSTPAKPKTETAIVPRDDAAP